MSPRGPLLLLLLQAGLGCGFHEEPPAPLYPGSRLGPQQVATLGGYVGWVDGRDVSQLGGAFELLPGCHVVTTPTSWGSSGTQGAARATTGAVTFAVPMLAGRHYLVVSNLDLGSAPTGGVSVRIDELDAAGTTVRAIPPTESSADVTACRQAQAGP